MPSSSHHMLFMEAVQTRLQALTLTGLSSSNITIREMVTDKGLTASAIQIAPYGAETITDATNIRDDIGYPSIVAIIAKGETTSPTLDQRLLWREQVRGALHKVDLSSIPDCHELRVTPYNVVEIGALMNSKTWVSAFLVRAFCREVRT